MFCLRSRVDGSTTARWVLSKYAASLWSYGDRALMRRGLAHRLTWLPVLLLSMPSVALAGQQVGENSAYAREMGFRMRFYYVSAGNGTGQIEYICQAFPGTTASTSTASAVWQVRKFVYDSSNRISTIDFAGPNDAFDQVCDNRASLSY